MKKGLIELSLICILLISPLILAEEQAQIYSGFDKFIDNVRLFFSGGNNKVNFALEIREKEVNSAIVNTKNGNNEEANKNLENAWKKLQIVQEKVTLNTAEEVTKSANKIQNKIKEQVNLSNDFEVYTLEEEKTGLTAEWIIEFKGKEGKNLTTDVVKGTAGEKVVVTNGAFEGSRILEIEKRIGEIDGEISNWVVENSVGEDGKGDNGLTWEVKNEIAKGDDGLKPEVKNSVKTYTKRDGTLKNDPLPDPNLDAINPDLYDPNARAPGDTIEEDNWVEKNEIRQEPGGIDSHVDEGGYAEGENNVDDEPCAEGATDCAD